MELLAVLEHSPLGCSMLQIRLTRVAVFPITVFMGPRIKDREEFIFHYCVESSTGKFFFFFLLPLSVLLVWRTSRNSEMAR